MTRRRNSSKHQIERHDERAPERGSQLNHAMFKSDAETYQVESLDLLKIWLSELPAIAWLANVSSTDVFAQAVASSTERPVLINIRGPDRSR